MPTAKLLVIVSMKKFIKDKIFGAGFLTKICVQYCAKNNLLLDVMMVTASENLRDQFFLPGAGSSTQLNQDTFALIINRFQKGYFLEIGANDGYTLSNTVYLEQHFGWGGLLVEANPKYGDSLKKRACNSALVAITREEGIYEFSDAGLYGGLKNSLTDRYKNVTDNAGVINVRGSTLSSLLDENKAPLVINFISIDVEGEELSIVEQLCSLEKYRFKCGCIEYNDRLDDLEKIILLLHQADYYPVISGYRHHDIFFVDKEVLHSKDVSLAIR